MIICIGEILLDIYGENKNSSLVMNGKLGGAPFNVAANIALNGGSSSFYGVVGSDFFGDYIALEASKYHIKNLKIERSDEGNTTLAYVSNQKGERSFGFVRNPGADYFFGEDFPFEIKSGDIVHFGSLMLGKKKGRVAFNRLYKLVKKEKALTSFDANLRLDIFSSKSEARDIYLKILPLFDIVKLSEDELSFLAKTQKIENFMKSHLKKDVILFVTKGSSGSLCYHKNRSYEATCLPLSMVDSTGAGDAFYARVLLELDNRPHKNNFDDINFSSLLTNANKEGAENTQFFGALKEVE
ncbi:MAG TPA: hypothetical protein DEF61_02055 [Firmicutes bacterium]|nr:hypothetical protein [Bacillota bacterium]